MDTVDLNRLAPLRWPTPAFEQAQGEGMTSQRARDRLVVQLWRQGIRHPAVLSAMRVTPRHLFVDEALASRAYENTALPVGHDQTISQPYVVALMSQFLAEAGVPLGRVLEVGTGSGYQTAILSQLAHEVYTVERIAPLQQRAKRILDALGLGNIHYRVSDGSWGWPEAAPFDAVLAAASPAQIPSSLMEQVRPGGRLIMPVGESSQRLVGLVRTAEGFRTFDLGPVRFVPMRSGVEA